MEAIDKSGERLCEEACFKKRRGRLMDEDRECARHLRSMLDSMKLRMKKGN